MNHHTCHALGCDVPIPARLLMHKAHWYAVPPELRRALWVAYVPGQERRKDPSRAYLRAAAQCVIAVAEQEGREIPAVWQRLARGDDA